MFVAAFAVNRCLGINIKAICYICKYTYELTELLVESCRWHFWLQHNKTNNICYYYNHER